jgi:hypothetical protein
MTNRTLQFCGYAYGTEPVQLTATINGQQVFSGAVATQNEPMPLPDININNAPPLFSVEDSPLFPTEFSGSYPMTITISAGDGIVVQNINSNYMWNPVNYWTSENSTINGTTLTIGTLTLGTPQIGDVVYGAPGEVVDNTQITAGSGTTWTVSISQNVSANLSGSTVAPGNATGFLPCYNGTPTNSEGTPDPRSSVTIDGVTQVPPQAKSQGIWTWSVYTGNVFAHNLNVSLGNVITA